MYFLLYLQAQFFLFSMHDADRLIYIRWECIAFSHTKCIFATEAEVTYTHTHARARRTAHNMKSVILAIFPFSQSYFAWHTYEAYRRRAIGITPAIVLNVCIAAYCIHVRRTNERHCATYRRTQKCNNVGDWIVRSLLKIIKYFNKH